MSLTIVYFFYDNIFSYLALAGHPASVRPGRLQLTVFHHVPPRQRPQYRALRASEDSTKGFDRGSDSPGAAGQL